MVAFRLERRTPCAEFPNDNAAIHCGSTGFFAESKEEPAAVSADPFTLARLPAPEPARPVLTHGVPRSAVGFLEAFGPTIARAAPARSDSAPTDADLARRHGTILPPADVDPVEGPAADADRFAATLEPPIDETPERIEIVDDLSHSLEGAIEERAGASPPPENHERSAATTAELEPAAEERAELDGAMDEDPFSRLLRAFEETAVALGASEGGVDLVRALFGATRLEGLKHESSLGDREIEALVAGGVVARTSRGIARTASFTEQVQAWRGILSGESEEFPACGALDEWGAGVLARILGQPARADGIRRELRRRGVAAFGLVADAA